MQIRQLNFISNSIQKFVKPETLTASILLVALGTILSRVTGLLRMRVFSSTLGAGESLDAFYTAFRVPDLLTSVLVAGTLSVAFIPVFSKYLNQDHVKAVLLAKYALVRTSLFMAVLMCILGLFISPIAKLLFSEFTVQQLGEVVILTRFIAVSQVLLSVSVLCSSILQTHKYFFWTAMAPSLYNLGMILGAILLYPKLGTTGIGIGILVGSLGHLLVQFPKTLHLLRGKNFFADIKKPLQELKTLYVARMIYMDIGQAGLFIATLAGTSLQAGTVSTFTMGYDLALAPVGIIASSAVTAVFPVLSRMSAEGAKERFYELFAKSAGKIFYWMTIAGFGVYVFRIPIIEILLLDGKFDQTAVFQTSSALAGFAVCLPALGLLMLLTRSFWALSKSSAPLIITWLSILLFALLAFSLGGDGHSLALSFSVCVWLSAILLLLKLNSLFSNLSKDFRLKLGLKFFNLTLSAVLHALPASILASIILFFEGDVVNFTFQWWAIVASAGLCASFVYFFAQKYIALNFFRIHEPTNPPFH